MKIRKVLKTDYSAIYDLVKTAFETAAVSDGMEQEFVLKLRSGDTFIPDLEFVAEDESGLTGHIMMTKQVIDTKQDEFIGVLVAPLCVKQEYRSSGIGSKLMDHACKEALKLGYKAAFLVGDPEYYKRFGYQQTSFYNIKNGTEIPDQYVLACPLEPDALSNIQGIINIIE